MKTKAMIGLYAAIVFSGTPASAEKLKKSTAPKLEEITIYARKKSEEINTTPITVTAFDRADLRKFQLSRINELEKLTPNLQFDTTSPISGSTQSAAVFIRGIGQSEFLLTNDSGVGIYVDGAYRARSLGAVLDTASIAQIEIIKGPQGMLFGKNTIGGAINILTEPPRDALSATITTRFGSDHRLDAVATADIPITPDLVTHWAFSSRQIDGYSERLLTGDKQGNEDMQSFFSKWLWRATDALNITLAIDGQDSQESSSPTSLIARNATKFDTNIDNSALSSTYNSIIGQNILLASGLDAQFDSRYLTLDPEKSFATGPNYSEVESLGGQISVDWQLAQVMLKSISAYRDLDTRFARDPDGSPITALHTRNDINHYQLSQEFQALGSAINERIEWIMGLYYFYEAGRDRVIADLYPSLFPAAGIPLSINGYYDAEQTSYAVYGQFSFELTKQLHLNIGARYTDEEKRFRSQQALADIKVLLLPSDTYTNRIDEWTPSIGMDYQWSDHAIVYFNYTEGFKSGGYVARYITPTAQPIEFSPEYVDNYEAGIKVLSADKRWHLHAAAFYADYTDIQLLVFDGIIPLTENAAKGRVRGAEASAKYHLNNHWLLSSSLGYVDADFTDVADNATVSKDSDFVNTPEWTAQLAIDYRITLAGGDQLQLTSDFSWRSAVANDAANNPLLIEGELGLWSARLAYQLVKADWELALYGKNLTDEVYIMSGASDIPTFGITEANYTRGREWGIETTYRLNP
jgi:iron complex outermembrane receptor protein